MMDKGIVLLTEGISLLPLKIVLVSYSFDKATLTAATVFGELPTKMFPSISKTGRFRNV